MFSGPTCPNVLARCERSQSLSALFLDTLAMRSHLNRGMPVFPLWVTSVQSIEGPQIKRHILPVTIFDILMTKLGEAFQMAYRSAKSEPLLNDIKRKFFLRHLVGEEQEENVLVSTKSSWPWRSLACICCLCIQGLSCWLLATRTLN